MRSIWLALLVAVPAANLAPGADSGGIRGLVSGMVYDAASRSIRAVVGAPGAAWLGEPLAWELDAAWLAPDGDQALAVSGGSVYWLKGLRSASLEWLAVPLPEGRPALVAWAADSTAAAVYAPGRLRLVNQAAGVVAGFSTDSLGGRITALAVAGDGAVLAGVEGVGLYRLSAADEPSLLACLTLPSSIVLTASGRLFVADRARDEILELRNWRELTEVLPFANASGGVSDPVAMAASPDARSLLVADSAGRRITFLDLASAALIGELSLDFEPARLEPLGDGASWLLTERRRPGDVLEVLAVGGEPAVFFIPVPAGESVAPQE